MGNRHSLTPPPVLRLRSVVDDTTKRRNLVGDELPETTPFLLQIPRPPSVVMSYYRP